MSHALKVRRSGIARIFKKTPFRSWLDEQDVQSLTYDGHPKEVARGWTTEMFVRECWNRGLDVRIGTTLKWSSGAKPRPFLEHSLRKVFSTIRF